MRLSAILTGLAALTLPNPALACFSGNEEYFFSPELPQLDAGEIALEIEMLSGPTNTSPPKARVIKVLSGRYSNELVLLWMNSCQSLPTKGERGIVVGQFITRGGVTALSVRGRRYLPEPLLPPSLRGY